jgi:hypothetical protein
MRFEAVDARCAEFSAGNDGGGRLASSESGDSPLWSVGIFGSSEFAFGVDGDEVSSVGSSKLANLGGSLIDSICGFTDDGTR